MICLTFTNILFFQFKILCTLLMVPLYCQTSYIGDSLHNMKRIFFTCSYGVEKSGMESDTNTGIVYGEVKMNLLALCTDET